MSRFPLFIPASALDSTGEVAEDVSNRLQQGETRNYNATHFGVGHRVSHRMEMRECKASGLHRQREFVARVGHATRLMAGVIMLQGESKVDRLTKSNSERYYTCATEMTWPRNRMLLTKHL
jgi:hypothetical protein